MRILIEEYQYDVADVRDVLQGIDALENVEGKVSVHYVGYFYNVSQGDCVFILPKVLLRDVDGQELAFGKYRPESIVMPEGQKQLTNDERDFLYGFAVWIYRAIVVYKNDKTNDSTIVYQKKITQAGFGSRRLSNTFLDILLALLQFNKDNQSFFFFVLKNLHAGYNKINWTRTIGTAAVGKAVNCTFTVSGLDADNGDQLLTVFDIDGGNGVIIVGDNEYMPGESFEFDYKANGKLAFDFVPITAGAMSLKMSVASELVTRADSVRLEVSTPDMNVEFQNVPDMVKQSESAEFNLLLATDQYGVKASARFVKGRGQIFISGYDATRDEGVALEHNNLVVFMPESTGETLIEFTVSSRYGLPVRKQISIQVNP